MTADVASLTSIACSIVQAWYGAQSGGSGIANAGLMMSFHFGEDYPLEEEAYLAGSRAQIKLISGERIQGMIDQFEPSLKAKSEGGRTSRGTVAAAIDLAERLNSQNLFGGLSDEERKQVAREMQRWLVTVALRDIANKERVKPEYDLTSTATVNIRAIIDAAEKRKLLGCVAQHLVGAKLELRFPNEVITRHSCSTADLPSGRAGDFELHDAVFHVTVAPTSGLIAKCATNVKEGTVPVVVVPEGKVSAVAALLDEAGLGRNVTVFALDSFLAQNLDELAAFDRAQFRPGLCRLVDVYNSRVDEAESDKFLMLQPPKRRR